MNRALLAAVVLVASIALAPTAAADHTWCGDNFCCDSGDHDDTVQATLFGACVASDGLVSLIRDLIGP